MKKKVLTFWILLCCLTSQAEYQDLALAQAKHFFAAQHSDETICHIDIPAENNFKLKACYTAQNCGFTFQEELLVEQYYSSKERYFGFAKKKDSTGPQLISYPETQSCFKYRKKRRIYLMAGVATACAGGLVFLGGLINTMMESPGESVAAASERQKRERNIFTICTVSGVSLAICSIPLFKAAHNNKVKFKSHMALKANVTSIILPNGYHRNAIGFRAVVSLH